MRKLAATFVECALGLLFPHFAVERTCSETEIDSELQLLAFTYDQFKEAASENAAFSGLLDLTPYLELLPEIHERLIGDAEAIYRGDPAARSVDEVILSYPGFLSIACYRLAHPLYDAGVPLLPRLISEWAHTRTGVDIHPGARIGERFCIDHGTGVVIGETTEIGDDVKIYQGVTLGALSVQKTLSGVKRHPTIGPRTIIYANATILGGETVVGSDSIIGGSAWITKPVPAFSIVDDESKVTTRKRSEQLGTEYSI